MKKILVLLLSLLMMVALVACDSQAPTVPNTDDTTPSTQDETPSSDDKTSEDKTPATSVVNDWIGVATYNIVRCSDQADPDKAIHPDNIVDFIVDNDIAICGLQEVEINSSRSLGWVKDEYYKDGSHQPRYIAKKVSEKTGEDYYWAFSPSLDGYHAPAHPELGDAQYGNALITKYPIVDMRYVNVAVHTVDPTNPKTQIADGYEQRSLLIATLDIDGTETTVIVTHFGLKESERTLAVQKLMLELEDIDTPVIFMGDLNCTLTSAQFQQIQTVLNPTSTNSTPPSMPSGTRIDHIFVSGGIQFKDIKSLPLTHSDHYPVLVKIRMPKKA